MRSSLLHLATVPLALASTVVKGGWDTQAEGKELSFTYYLTPSGTSDDYIYEHDVTVKIGGIVAGIDGDQAFAAMSGGIIPDDFEPPSNCKREEYRPDPRYSSYSRLYCTLDLNASPGEAITFHIDGKNDPAWKITLQTGSETRTLADLHIPVRDDGVNEIYYHGSININSKVDVDYNCTNLKPAEIIVGGTSPSTFTVWEEGCEYLETGVELSQTAEGALIKLGVY